MFYEERCIDGQWEHRTTPAGEWRPGRWNMAAPDTRDSVERIVAEMREMADWPHATADRMDLFRWADRLSALPQQAGGEDAKDAARFVWWFTRDHTTDEIVELTLRAINKNTNPSLDEWRAAIDAAIGGTGDA